MTVVLWAVLAQAQPIFLTEVEAVGMALRHNAELGVLRASESVAAAELGAARAVAQPEFRFSRNNLGLDPETLEARTTVGLRWSPPRFGEGKWKMTAARARQQEAGAATRIAAGRIAVEVRLAYRRAAIAQEQVRMAGQAAALRRQMLEIVRKQVAAGLKDAAEADLAEFQLTEAQAAVNRSQSQARLHSARLSAWIGSPDGPDLSLASDAALFQSPAPEIDVGAAQSSAMAQRGETGIVESQCRQSEAAVGLARNQRYPWFSFVQATRRTTELPGRGAWGFQFGVDLPLIRTSAAAEQRLAAAQLVRCQAQVSAIRAQVKREVAQAAAEVQAAAEELVELERLFTGPALRALERVRAAQANGRADKVETLLAEVRRVELRQRWLDKRVEYARLESEFESAAGIGAQ